MKQFDRSPSVQPVGTSFAGYRLVRLLGSGASGDVWEAVSETDPNTRGRTFAIKTLRTQTSPRSDAIPRFVREAKILSLLGHPHIVSIHENGVAETTVRQDGTTERVHFLVMDFVSGESLESMLQKNGPMSEQTAAQVFLPICAALAHSHERGVVHRDIKPANILFERVESGARIPKLVDFGLGKRMVGEGHVGGSDPLTGMGTWIGTPLYMSPEQAKGYPATSQSDLWSLGAVLYECVTGRPLFHADTPMEAIIEVASGEFLAPRDLKTNLSMEFEAILLSCLRSEPEERISSAKELGLELLQFADEETRSYWKRLLQSSTGRVSELPKVPSKRMIRSSAPPTSSISHAATFAQAPDPLRTTNAFVDAKPDPKPGKDGRSQNRLRAFAVVGIAVGLALLVHFMIVD